MKKKIYNAPAIDIVRVQTESSFAAGTSIHISSDEATEEAQSKNHNFFDGDDAQGKGHNLFDDDAE